MFVCSFVHECNYYSVCVYICTCLHISGNYNGWLESLPLEHKPFLSNLSSIQDFYDLFGDLTATGASLDISDIGVKYCGEFITKFGGK